MCKRLIDRLNPGKRRPYLIVPVVPPSHVDKIPEKHEIPLQKVAAKVQIFGGIAKIALMHEYKNTTKDTIETKFTFAVDPEMAVAGLTVITEEKELKAKIMPKEKGKEKYDDAVSSGDAAYLLQYDKDQQDLLTMNIGNLQPDRSLTVQLDIVAKLEVVDKSWGLLLSPTFTPLFINKVQGDDDEERKELPAGATTPAVSASKVPYSWEVEVDIVANGPIQRLVCFSHKVDIEYGEGRRSARLAMKLPEAPDTDFNLVYRSQDISEPKLYLQPSEAHSKEIAALVTFFPDFCPPSLTASALGSEEKEGEESKVTVDTNEEREYEDEDEEELLEGGGEFIFVIDRSGSMGGDRIVMACQAAQLFLKSLPQNSRFNIVSFGSSYSFMFSKSVDYTQKNLNSALDQLKGFGANMGGTQIYNPLVQVFKQKQDPNFPVNVFLLTDGAVGQPDAVINLVGKNSKTARCHTFGIGSGASRHLVKKAAIAGKGTYQFIQDGEANMNAKVIASLSRAVKPALAGLKARFTGGDKALLLQGPSSLPNVFHGQPFVMTAILSKDRKKEGSFVIEGAETKNGQTVKFECKVEDAVVVPEGEELFKLCARLALNEMEGAEKKDEKKMTQVSTNYGVLCSETSLVAVERLKTKVEGEAKPVVIPIAITKDSQPSQDFQSARFSKGMLSMKKKKFMKSAAPRSAAPMRCGMSAPMASHQLQKKSIRRMERQDQGARPRGLMAKAKQFFGISKSAKSEALDSDLYSRQIHEMAINESKKEMIAMDACDDDEQEEQKEHITSLPTPSTQINMKTIIDLQAINGSWSFSAHFTLLLKESGKDISQTPPTSFATTLKEDQRSQAWATVLALWLLDTFCGGQKNEWKRIAAKGNKFLKNLGVTLKDAISLI